MRELMILKIFTFPLMVSQNPILRRLKSIFLDHYMRRTSLFTISVPTNLIPEVKLSLRRLLQVYMDVHHNLNTVPQSLDVSVLLGAWAKMQDYKARIKL